MFLSYFLKILLFLKFNIYIYIYIYIYIFNVVKNDVGYVNNLNVLVCS